MASTSQRATQLKEEGNALFRALQYEASILKFTDAIQLDDRNPSFYGNRAASFFFLRRFHDVLNDCQMALRIDPRYIKAWLRKGDAHDALTQYADSIESYNHALSLTPSRGNDRDELKRRIEYVTSKILAPHAVGLETLLTLARLHSIQIPHLELIHTPSQIDELRKALFRHPKWSFPPSSHLPNSHHPKPHPQRVRFLLVPSDDHLPVASRSDVELELEEEPAKNYDREVRRLLGGCGRYTKEVVVAEDWEACSQSRPYGVGLGRFHSVYEVYYGTAMPNGSAVLSLNHRVCNFLGRNNIYGPVLIAKAWYVKTERRLVDLTFSGSQTHLAPQTPGNALLGYDYLSSEELRSGAFQGRVGNNWRVTCRRVLGGGHS